jgi:hypothetical protein
MAPELSSGEGVTEKVDVYSFALVVWSVVSNREPNPTNIDPQRPGHVDTRTLDVESSWPADFRELLVACWHADSTRRPAFKDVVRALSRMQEARAAAVASHKIGTGPSMRRKVPQVDPSRSPAFFTAHKPSSGANAQGDTNSSARRGTGRRGFDDSNVDDEDGSDDSELELDTRRRPRVARVLVSQRRRRNMAQHAVASALAVDWPSAAPRSLLR